VEESLAENQQLVNERRIEREEESVSLSSNSQISKKSSSHSASLSSEDSVTMKDAEEPFEVVEISKDDAVEDPEVNIFFESQNEPKSDSPRTVISEDDIEEERKKMEEDLKKECETSPLPPFTISDFEKHVRGVPDGPEEITPASSITNVTDVSTEKNISTSQASIDSESTLKSEDLHVNRELAKLRSDYIYRYAGKKHSMLSTKRKSRFMRQTRPHFRFCKQIQRIHLTSRKLIPIWRIHLL